MGDKTEKITNKAITRMTKSSHFRKLDQGKWEEIQKASRLFRQMRLAIIKIEGTLIPIFFFPF